MSLHIRSPFGKSLIPMICRCGELAHLLATCHHVAQLQKPLASSSGSRKHHDTWSTPLLDAFKTTPTMVEPLVYDYGDYSP